MAVMKEYFENDQLDKLPKPIMQTSLLTNLKNNRELPVYGFKQSENLVQRNISKQSHVGDGNKNKTLEDVNRFVNDLENLYSNNSLAVVNSRIRFDHKDLYIQLRKLYSRMSEYQYRFIIIYWIGYLEEYISSCEQFLQQKQAEIASLNEIYSGQNYETFKSDFDVRATSAIFAEKLGKHPETQQIFKILGF